MLDIKPIFGKLLELTSDIEYKYNEIGDCNCYALKDIVYISSDNQVYPCGPSSKVKDNRYMICDLKKSYNYEYSKINEDMFNKKNRDLCLECMFSDMCSVCPLANELASEGLCEYALKEISLLTKVLLKKRIVMTGDIRIIKKEKCYYVINFKTFRSYKLGNFLNDNQVFNQGTIECIMNTLKNNKDKKFFLANLYIAYKNKDIQVV